MRGRNEGGKTKGKEEKRKIEEEGKRRAREEMETKGEQQRER